jgi:hypothetical protein
MLYVLTDGGRARFVRRSPETASYVTVEEIDGGEQLRTLRNELRSSPPARTFPSKGSPRRSAVGELDFYRQAKEAFVASVAERAIDYARREQMDGVFLAAPARLIEPLKARLDKQIPVAGAIRKDLTKAPDHELGAWLNESLSDSHRP